MPCHATVKGASTTLHAGASALSTDFLKLKLESMGLMLFVKGLNTITTTLNPIWNI